jgi:tetratricopeptide (TPR) repeat protein
MKQRTLLTFFIIAFITKFSFAENPSAEAERFLTAEDWPNVIKAYGELARKDPSNAQAWYRLGRGYHETGKYEDALKAYNEAEKKGFHQMSVLVRKSKTYSMMQNSKEAMDMLKQAADLGFSDTNAMSTDKEFAALRKDSRFDSVLSQVKRNEKPCGFDPEFRQFDFWIGEWDVFVSGSLAGKSKIELILKDCVIVENWESPGLGYAGKSYNVYNPGLKKWQQFWVDSSGGPVSYTGQLIDREMRFESEMYNADGTKTLRKMTFYNLGPDKVRQYIQLSSDGGKTWTNGFDGEYRRKTNEK